jgi:hypothetical protein
MRQSLKICSLLFLGLAIISMPELLVGCANPGAAVRQAERLVAEHPAELRAAGQGPAEAVISARTFPLKPVDTSRKHLLELYAGQQEIIVELEEKAGSRTNPDVPAAGPSEEGPASDLPPNISQDDLLRILGQQQKLIKALTNRNAKRDGRLTTGR